MKILKILNSNDGGGVFTCEIQFIKELMRRNVTVDAVIVGNGKNMQKYEAVCNRVIKLPELDARYGGAVLDVLSAIADTYSYGVRHAAQLSAVIEKGYYDTVIYRRPVLIHLAGKLAALIGSRALWHLPCIARSTFAKIYYNYFSRRYKIVQVANSSFTQQTLGSQCRFVVYPGFDEARVFKTEPVYRQKLNIGNDVPVYGIASRITEDKAQDIVTGAFVGSKAARNGAHLLVAGGPVDSAYAQKVKLSAGDLLDKQIHFLGQIDDMAAFYSSINILINGHKGAEPFGISVVEALGAGVPVIAYYLGGPSETIKDNVSGWLVKKATVDNYKMVFDMSYERLADWHQMGDIAKRDVGKYTVSANVDKLIDIINKVYS